MRLYEIVDSTLRFKRLPVQIFPLEKSGIAFFSNGGFGRGTLVLRLEIHLKGSWVETRVLGYSLILFGRKCVSGESWVWKTLLGVLHLNRLRPELRVRLCGLNPSDDVIN